MPQTQCNYVDFNTGRYGMKKSKEETVFKRCIEIVNIIYESDKNLDYESEKEIWNYILEIRKFILDNSMITIRILTRLCYQLDEKEQIKEIIRPFFKINYLFDQSFFDFPENYNKGIVRFMTLLNSTFGNSEHFIEEFKKVKTMIKFAELGWDKKLIKEYSYLKNISLPVRGFEDLRINLFAILKKFNQLFPVVCKEEFYRQLQQEIMKYRQQYIREYKKQHLYYYNKYKYFRRKLSTMCEYRVLEKLTAIDYLREHCGPIAPKDYIDDFFQGQCGKKDLDTILKEQPRCSCGFAIGEMVVIPDVDKILPALRKHIHKYISFLKSDPFAIDRLKTYTDAKPFSPVKQIISLPPTTELDITNLNTLLTEDMISKINRILSDVPVIEIDIQEVADNISGSYRISELYKISGKIRDYIRENQDIENENDNILIKIIK